MKKLDPVQTWIDNVGLSHTNSDATAWKYRYSLEKFCKFVGITPEEILRDYESAIEERPLRRKYARLIQAFAAHMNRERYAIGTINAMTVAIKSFFKYTDLPLGYIPIPRMEVLYHNRDIRHDEIQTILSVSMLRAKAYYAMIAQSGLRPNELSQLKLKHIEPDFSKGVIPCKIEVPKQISKGRFGAYFSFMGPETVKHLKAYLATRSNIGPESYIFSSEGVEKKICTNSISSMFARTIETLKQKGLLKFKQEEPGKPRSIRLYNLRKFFRKHAGQAGIEYVNFWMGHKTNYRAPHIPASDVHYFSREDVEFQRQLYAEKALPFLRLETTTPTETEKIIAQQQKEIEELRETVAQLQEVTPDVKAWMEEMNRKLDEKMNLLDKKIEELRRLEKIAPRT